MRGFVGAIDQGTTSTRFLIFDRKGAIVGSAQKEHEQIYPKPGWVEHNATEIWRNTVSTMADALASAGLSASDLCQRRRHQSARDDAPLGSLHRGAARQRDCLAGHAHG